MIRLQSTDSTNNYAMRLIDADKARHGLTVVASEQTSGRGQRGRSWLSSSGDSLLMSIIVRPRYSLLQQPLFNCAITVAIATVIADLSQHWSLQVKWPNDIILNDKKAGGILIENVIRGSEWLLSIIGFGLNINQSFMPDELPFATSLFIEAGLNFENDALLYAVRNSVLAALSSSMPSASIMNSYNNLLFRRDQLQAFAKDSVPFTARISHVLPNGQIVLILGDGSEVAYTHGDISWQWG